MLYNGRQLLLRSRRVIRYSWVELPKRRSLVDGYKDALERMVSDDFWSHSIDLTQTCLLHFIASPSICRDSQHFYIRGTKNENFSDLFIPMTFFHLKELTYIKRVQTVTYIKVIYIFSFVENSFFFEYNRFSYNLELHLFFLHWKKNILNRGHLEKLTLHNFRWIYVMISVWPMDSYFRWLIDIMN